MITDGNTISPEQTLEADVVIVGSGPAGLTLAREFAGQALNVIVLESGEFGARRSLKKLNEGDTSGDPYPNPRWGRARQFGGTPNRWQIHIADHLYGARYAPLEPIDFETRDFMPYSGWEITRNDLDPYYARAQVHCGLGAYEYETDYWHEPGQDAIPFKGGRLVTSMFQFGARDVWTKHYADVTQNAPNIRVVTAASVVEILTDDGGTNVTSVRAMNFVHQSFSVRAKVVILAVGCIESTRLLMLSTDKHRDGIGNDYDVLGRYFMDHPQSYLNILTPNDRKLFETTSMYDLRPHGQYGTMAKLTFSEETMRKEKLQNICFVLFPRRDHFMSEAFQSFFSVALAMYHASRPSQLGFHMKTMAKGWRHLAQIGLWELQGKAPYPYLAHGGWAGLANKASLFDVFEVFSLLEQAPDPANRITLTDAIDPNGTRKVHIHWKFTEADRQSVERSRRVFDAELAESQLGRMTWHPDPYTSASSVHPLGGTRMHSNPHLGVVDAQCKVQGVSNLYIASSGVFPTSGYANPTLTVVALAVRIAEQVKKQLQHVPELKPLMSA
jgi:choline dehydrogenase-like flavoprotein